MTTVWVGTTDQGDVFAAKDLPTAKAVVRATWGSDRFNLLYQDFSQYTRVTVRTAARIGEQQVTYVTQVTIRLCGVRETGDRL